MCMEKPKAVEQKPKYPSSPVVRLTRRASRVTLKPNKEHMLVCCTCGRVHNVAVNREVEIDFSSNAYETIREMKKLLDAERKRSK